MPPLAQEVSEAWKRLKVKSVGKTIAGAKIYIESKQCKLKTTNKKNCKDCIN